MTSERKPMTTMAEFRRRYYPASSGRLLTPRQRMERNLRILRRQFIDNLRRRLMERSSTDE